MNRIRQIILPSITLIIILVGVILYQIKTYKPENLGCATRDLPKAFCGNSDLTGNAVEGKTIFNSNCAACHKMDARSTGPALREIDSIVYVKWLSNKNQTIDSSKIEEYGIDYHRVVFSKALSEKELSDLIEYCNY